MRQEGALYAMKRRPENYEYILRATAVYLLHSTQLNRITHT